jgi:hypothetical protein
MLLSRAELSSKIQWLIDIAGSRNIIEAVCHYFTKCRKHKIQFMKCNSINKKYKNKLVFYTQDTEIGHWIYFDRNGNEFNSYKLQHQLDGTHQFCQTFALIYLLNDHGIKSVPKFANRLQPNCWNNNLCVAIDCWRWIFNTMFDNILIADWLNNVFVELNASYEIYNTECSREFHKIKLLPQRIDKHVVNTLLDDILLNSNDIVFNT